MIMEAQFPIDMSTAAVTHSNLREYVDYHNYEAHNARKPMIIESAWPLLVNSRHWLTVICTPSRLKYLVLGFLFNEGIISGLDDVLNVEISRPPEEVIRVELCNQDAVLPQRRTLTSGCGGGITFIDLAAARKPLCSSFQITPFQISTLMACLQASVAHDYQQVGGFHTAGLSDGRHVLAAATDIGRHNTLDKIAGECLARNISMKKAILLTTGRISVEMLGKAARMQVPVVATLNSPTSLAVELAREWNITLAGYVRGERMHIYTHPERILMVKLPLAGYVLAGQGQGVQIGNLKPENIG